MVLAQPEVSNPEKTERLKALHMAVKARNIPSLLVITKVEKADKRLLSASGNIKVKPNSSGAKASQSPPTERPRDMRNLYRSDKARRCTGSRCA